MTNTTGPAQQRDQPTQLAADEAAELDRLINRLSSAEWESGFEDGLHSQRYGADRDDTAREKAKAARNEAVDAIRSWLFDHAPKPEILWRDIPGVTR